MPAVFQCPAYGRYQRQRHIETAAAAPLREGEDPSGVLVAAGAGWAVFSDAGLIDFRQGTLEGGP